MVQGLFSFTLIHLEKNMFSFLFKKQSAPAPVVQAQKTKFEQELDYARTIWQLPENYAEWFSHSNFSVCVVRGIDDRDSQSPLHRVMNAWHSDVPKSLRDELLASEEYQQVILHVFAKQTEASLNKLLAKMGEHGYWGPMSVCVQDVLKRKWYGAELSVCIDEKGRIRYSYTAQA